MKITHAQKKIIRQQLRLLEDPNWKPTPEERATQANLLRETLDKVYEDNGIR
jgi:hypothetical protein